MHKLYKYKYSLSAIFCVIAFSLYLVIPNFCQDDKPWFFKNRISLGLDLQGGVHMLLTVDVEEALEERISSIKTIIQKKLENQNIVFKSYGLKKSELLWQLTYSSKTEDDYQAFKELVNKEFPSLQVEKISSHEVKMSFSAEATQEIKNSLLDKSLHVIQKRIDNLGAKESVIRRAGQDRIVVELPGFSDTKHLHRLLGKTAKLSFYPLDSDDEEIEEEVLINETYKTHIIYEKDAYGVVKNYRVKYPPELTGEYLTDAGLDFNLGEPVVSFSFDSRGSLLFANLTKKHKGKRIAIVLDNEIISSPVVNTAILNGSGFITGNFTADTAHELAMMLNSGALPVSLQIMEEKTIGPHLGEAAVIYGKYAFILSVISVLIFMFLVYGMQAFLANIMLCVNILLVLAFMTLLEATLTLSGIVGLILTMGMAVDANVLIFERIREYEKQGLFLSSAVEKGFSSASAVILDSNITTLIASIVLFAMNSGPVQGFALTLSVGIISSMFSSLLLLRCLMFVWYDIGNSSRVRRV